MEHQNFEENPAQQIDIKPHEKRAIISTFLHNDFVFSKLCHFMFKPDEDEALDVYEPKDQLALKQEQITNNNALLFQDALNRDTMNMTDPQHDVFARIF